MNKKSLPHPLKNLCHLCSGFTLIEVLVVTSLAIIIMLGTVALFMTFLLNQARVTQRQQLKNAGDNAIRQMIQVLREARRVEPCETARTSLDFIDPGSNSGVYQINNSNSRIASTSAGNTIYLTPETIAASGFSASCYGEPGGQFLRIQFTLETEAFGLRSSTVSQIFRTSLNIRN